MKKSKSILFTLLFFILLFTLIFSTTFLSELSFYDELWNFQNIYKMYNGSLIYSDNNVIITPIFFILGNFIFNIFSANIFMFRIYNVFIYFIKFIIIYLIFRKLKINKLFSVLYLILWFIFDNSTMFSGANYNMLAIIFSLLGILHYILNYEKRYYHLIQGIIIFLTFFTKQTIGTYYALAIVLFELIELGFKKDFFKNQFIKSLTFLPCLIISLLIMFFKGNLIDFINMCFGNILEFGSTNLFFYKNELPSILFMILTIIFSIFILVKIKELPIDIKRNIKLLLCVSICLSFNVFPLINTYHVKMSVCFYYLLFVYIIHSFLIGEIFTSNSQYNIIVGICFAILCAIFTKILYQYFSNYQHLQNFEYTHPFYNTTISEENLDAIDKMTKYITEKKNDGITVIVLSYEAAAYMVPLSINNNELDLPFSGNLGYNGIQNTLKKISNMKNTEFLIFTNEDDCFWQESIEIREYIINNMQKTDEFINYSIYINK